MKSIHSLLALLFLMTFIIVSCGKKGSTAPELVPGELIVHSFKRINQDFLASEEKAPIIDYDIRQAYRKQYLSMRESIRVLSKCKTVKKNLFGLAGGAEMVTIYPTGQFPQDVINVQAVVDDAGERGVDLKLVLKATNENGQTKSFNFEGAWVLIRGSYYYGQTGSVTIAGETLNSHQTTILKGYDSRLFGMPNDYKPFLVLARGDVTFNNLKFEEGGIRNYGGVAGPDNMRVENCIFQDYNHMAGALENRGTGQSYTIRNNRFENVRRAFAMYNSNRNCVVENNYFSSEEILFHNCFGKIEFRGNTVNAIALSNPNEFTTGLVLVENYDANFVIRDNHFTINQTRYGSGIYIGPNSDGTQFQITDNMIDIKSKYYGVIDMEGYLLGTPIKNVTISNNVFKGNAAWAISANNIKLSPPASQISSITISENDLHGFESNCSGVDVDTDPYLRVGRADIFLGRATSNISVSAKKKAAIVNYGVGNTIAYKKMIGLTVAMIKQ